MTAIKKRPNFLLIVADDLGFSDVSPFGSEIPTPALDSLAQEGLRFTDYHTAAACSPTRSMLMSGTDNHLAGIGVMYEHRVMDPERWNLPGHEGHLNMDVAALPELLADNGYWNVISGKWHLGFRDEHLPSARGFHKSWALLPGCNNHFGWEPNWVNNDGDFPRVVGNQPPLYVEDGVKVMPEANTANSPDGFYSSTFYVDNMIDYFRARTPEEAEKPFFAFLPFSAPHWPLQCLPEDRDKFKGVYDAGPDVLRQQRLQKLVELGIINASIKPHDVVAKTAEWDDMTPEEQQMSARAMEVYAGMVTAMDREIGKMVDHLKEIGEYDNTVIIFQSDNGAEGAALEAVPTMGKRLLDAIDKYYDNSYENLGNHDSFIWYGPRWAQASTAPSRLMKAFITEGGIRVPMIVRYPPFTQSIEPGGICRSFTTAMDVMPTFLDLAGIEHPNHSPANPRDKAAYRDRQVYSMRGRSMAPYLQSPDVNGEEAYGVHGDSEPPIGWEAHGRASLRHGKYKIVFIPLGQPTGIGKWQLYDMDKDPGETDDLADRLPDVRDRLLTAWDRYQQETGTVFGPPIKGIPQPLLPNQIGGDPTEDQKAWMRVGPGKRFPGHVKATSGKL